MPSISTPVPPPQSISTGAAAKAAGQDADLSKIGDIVNVLDPGLNDHQAYLGAFVFLAVVGIVLLVFFMATNRLARQARLNLEMKVATEEGSRRVANYFAITADTARSRTDNMNVWPTYWPNLAGLLSLLLYGIVFLIFYRIWALWVAATIVRVLRIGGLSSSSRS